MRPIGFGSARLACPGLAAGERAVGRRVFVEDAGDFWLIFETRPYMRARAALAATLWRLGRREEAVEHQRELLRLNPRDNQGLRYRRRGDDLTDRRLSDQSVAPIVKRGATRAGLPQTEILGGWGGTSVLGPHSEAPPNHTDSDAT